MRFTDYFRLAFSVVSASQFPWLKLFRESVVVKIADVPVSHVSEMVYKTSVDWINKRSYDALGSFVLWALDIILVDLSAQQCGLKGSKKVVQETSSKSQICDFGLAKWLPKQWTHHNVSKFEGTFGYFAPEYFMHGVVDEKTDVFSFGVLLLELITGRQALDDAGKSLVLWAKPLLDKSEVKELVDPCLDDNYNPEEINRVILTASLCVEQNPVLRPRMSQVVVLLRGQANYPDCQREHQKRYLQRTYSEELLDAE